MAAKVGDKLGWDDKKEDYEHDMHNEDAKGEEHEDKERENQSIENAGVSDNSIGNTGVGETSPPESTGVHQNKGTGAEEQANSESELEADTIREGKGLEIFGDPWCNGSE